MTVNVRALFKALVPALAMAVLVAACTAADDTEDASTNPTAAVEAEDTVDADDSIPEPSVPEPSDEFAALDLAGRIDGFLAQPSSTKGALVAEAMGASGDVRWGPWLLDLYRLGRSTRIDAATVEAFEALSGIESAGHRTDDYRNYGNWVYNSFIEPGEGYREWKMAVLGSIDTEFADLLAETPGDLLLSQIQWGGVTRGGIPELNDPERVPAGSADWMLDDELILGAVVDGVAVAYPIRILGHHELANDRIAGVPVSMVYCTLCRSGLLFDRRVGDQVLDFETSGLLIESNKIMVDRQTDTLWRHQTGVGLTGPLVDVELAQFPVLTTTWGEWVAEHPGSEVLAIPGPIFPDASVSPEQPPVAYAYEPGETYRFYYEDPDVWFPVFDTPPVFDLKEQVLGLSDGEQALAVQVAALDGTEPRVFVVGERAFGVVPTSAGARVYDLSGSGLDDGALDLEPAAAGEEFVNLTDGTRWPRVAVPQLFWFAWFGQHPDTTWWPA